MKSRFPRRHGAALIITLAMIAMMTFLVVAFFSRSLANLQIETSSTGNVRADLLARSASGIIVSDFRTEIIAGSTASGSGTQAPIYVPKTPAAAIPAVSRVAGGPGYAPEPFVNLVKQSTGRFFPNAAPWNTNSNAVPIIQTVTNVPTDMVSPNGRKVVNYRWDSPTSLTPLGPMLCVGDLGYSHYYSSAMLPHWVMMTRDGVPASQDSATIPTGWSNYSPDNTTAAIGRFAYNIYNVGGLIDVNAAGYDESGAVPVTAVGQKGTLGLAQLSVIPGITSTSNAALFAKTWRNSASTATVSGFSASDNYLAYLGFSTNGTSSITGSPFFGQGPRNGFLKAAASMTASDNRILGRQDLIRLAVKTGSPYGLNLTSLPYVTHFSRELNAPSWSPTQNALAMGGNNGAAVGGLTPYAYLDNKDNPLAINRSLTNVRAVTSGANWRRLTGELAVDGEPLIKYRFPLSWLALLQDKTPSTLDWDLTDEATNIVNTLSARNVANGGSGLPGSTANEQAAWLVQRAFGLVWNKTNYRWDYTGSPTPSNTPTAVVSNIEILGDATSTTAVVCKESREPNFFELLKAGILSGSLGNASDLESMCASIGEDSNPDYHVIQIGANIIDQADSDSYPTRIAFGFEMDSPPNLLAARGTSNTPVSTGEVKVFAGVEDLPYIYTFVSTPYRIPLGEPNVRADTDPNSATQNPTRDTIDGWLQFVLWKPQQPAVTSALPPGFRILFTGSDIHLTYYGNGDTDPTPPVEYPPNSGVKYRPRDTSPPLPDQANVTFSDTMTDFRAPTLLGGLSSASVQHNFSSSQPQGRGTNPNNPNGNTPLPRGMWLGETYRPERVAVNGAAPNTTPVYTHTEFRCFPDSRFELQYKDGSGVYRTYQRYDRFGVGTGQYIRGRGLFGYADNPYGLQQAGCPSFPPSGVPFYQSLDVSTLAMSAIDPRSQRYGLLAHYLDEASPSFTTPAMVPVNWTSYLKNGWSPKSNGYTPYSMAFGPASGTAGRFNPNYNGGTRQNPWSGHSADTVITDATPFWADNIAATTAGSVGYKDMDMVPRRADGDATNSVRPIQLAGANAPNTAALGRVLNRPFRSVGELGYVFRDEPYKSLNLLTPNSADSALLDLFSVNDQPAMVAGKVNLNTQVPEVLQALIVGASRDELVSAPNFINATDALDIATKLRDNTKDTTGAVNTGPLVNPAEIANRLATILPVANNADKAIKMRREVVGRALAGSGQTRTWNFLIDIIAQSGRFAPSATTAQQFVVEGEKRYWLHVAIDRYTGQVIDQQLEPVME